MLSANQLHEAYTLRGMGLDIARIKEFMRIKAAPAILQGWLDNHRDNAVELINYEVRSNPPRQLHPVHTLGPGAYEALVRRGEMDPPALG
ncbi:ssDNA binding protein [Pseudomonas phage DDSR119]|nr:ssDNA binding protein [Pseudomonas phage DDSR119]